MADWDRNTPQLEANLTAVLRQARDAFRTRCLPTLALMKKWHTSIMERLDPDDPAYVGTFRGEPGVHIDVHVDGHLGTPFAKVAADLTKFETQLQRAAAYLDRLIPVGAIPTAAQQQEVIQFCAWAHFEWIRIHPFMNGNGRTARLWTAAIAMRYNLPPFLKLRPRPDFPYGALAAAALQGGNWRDLIPVFATMMDAQIHSLNTKPPQT
jgi:hypothetical protein